MAAAYEIANGWEEPDELRELTNALVELRPDADVSRIRHAYYIAERAHTGQTRESGQPYITHPLAVARIVVDLHMDDDTIVAALLHDVLEDCPKTTREDLAAMFGETVA